MNQFSTYDIDHKYIIYLENLIHFLNIIRSTGSKRTSKIDYIYVVNFYFSFFVFFFFVYYMEDINIISKKYTYLNNLTNFQSI